MFRKGLVCAVIILFIGTSFVSAFKVNLVNESKPMNRGNWLYVGGSGLNNYTKIQDAVNDAVDGDTIYVFDDSSPYFENVVVSKSINLMGENKDTTIIDANYQNSAVRIESNYVTVCGFTLQNSGPKEWHDSGVHIGTSDIEVGYCNISGNNIVNNFDGIYCIYPRKNLIENNIIAENKHNGIILHVAYGDEGNVRIFNNTIINNSNDGIIIYETPSNTISGNTIMNNGGNGIELCTPGNSVFNNIIKNQIFGIKAIAGHCHIYSNIILENDVGLFVFLGPRSTFEKNNFIENDCNAKYDIPLRISGDRWIKNYWDDYTGFGPKVIDGTSTKNSNLLFLYVCLASIYLVLWGKLPPFPEPELIEYPTKEYDWHPALKPYNISIESENHEIMKRDSLKL